MLFDWENIDTVLLDMDGTLLDLHFDSHFWLDHLPNVLAEHKGVSLDEAKKLMHPILEGHARTLNWYCVHFWSGQVGFDIMPHKHTVAHNIAYRETAEEFLRECNEYCDDVRMVTNAHRKVLELKIEITDIDQYFVQMLCSHELGHPKEDDSFWSELNNHTPFDPERTLLIDDNEDVLESAERYGIKHLFSIARPDSSRPRSSDSRFFMIDRFVQAEERMTGRAIEFNGQMYIPKRYEGLAYSTRYRMARIDSKSPMFHPIIAQTTSCCKGCYSPSYRECLYLVRFARSCVIFKALTYSVRVFARRNHQQIQQFLFNQHLCIENAGA